MTLALTAIMIILLAVAGMVIVLGSEHKHELITGAALLSLAAVLATLVTVLR